MLYGNDVTQFLNGTDNGTKTIWAQAPEACHLPHKQTYFLEHHVDSFYLYCLHHITSGGYIYLFDRDNGTILWFDQAAASLGLGCVDSFYLYYV